VLFFEYDHDVTRKAGKPDPAAVWAELRGAGYAYVRIWNNFDKPIQVLPIDELPTRAGVLDKPLIERGYHYWDVAVVHADDDAGRAALDQLFASGP
jgi:hypothetical protein